MVLDLLQKSFAISLCAILLSIATVVHADLAQTGPEPQPADQIVAVLEELVVEDSQFEPTEGVATYYAKRFIGRKTASGQRYHPDKMTGAHYTLPLGTVVRVLNPANNTDVHVTINDRCAPKKFPFIDLSRAAAKKIGLWGKGKIKVVIIPLPEEDDDELDVANTDDTDIAPA